MLVVFEACIFDSFQCKQNLSIFFFKVYSSKSLTFFELIFFFKEKINSNKKMTDIQLPLHQSHQKGMNGKYTAKNLEM